MCWFLMEWNLEKVRSSLQFCLVKVLKLYNEKITPFITAGIFS